VALVRGLASPVLAKTRLISSEAEMDPAKGHLSWRGARWLGTPEYAESSSPSARN
jgi:hypothetical protein